ncbi:MAG: DHHA1 domain protein [Candidatus Argoarchaeum ethanivorans]|uniref:DHHA1 domain protein n=1 Tax=Candidatus Argoarchaeum ethanivorans TaxID=2608793 RepID=A0A811T2A3_9EURY|nr:MAG: DHHA1 domain protein [Candidatus Argoarchaeum ethanivorans]
MLSEMMHHARKCASVIKSQREVVVVSHIDADGLASAAIICKALERAGICFDAQFVKQLGEDELSDIANFNPPFVIFTDLGSTMIEQIKKLGINAVVSDHHQSPSCLAPGDQKGNPLHLNPHLFGINGSQELSGSGTTFLIACALGDFPDQNRELADLAVVGAVGDLQHIKEGRLTGANRSILEIARDAKVLSYKTDVLFFGKQTRPVFKLLQYASDPYINGLTGNESACIAFLKDTNIRSQGERWRRWIDLEKAEKQRIISKLVRYQLSEGVPAYKLQRMIGEVYILLRETEGVELRDAQEYSTLLNATARYDHAKVGLAVCMGERGDAFEEAQELLANHRKNLVDGLNFVKENGVTTLESFQYFDSGNRIRDTIVGIVAGMSQTIVSNRSLPIIAFASASGKSDHTVKVSARGNQDLVRRGLNLAAALSTAAKKVEGTGGGHDIAAGATIPSTAKDEFIIYLNEEIKKQIFTATL